MSHSPRELEEGKIARLFFRYSLPAIVATTASALYNIIDRMFIGNGVGPLAISGLALTFPIMNLAIALGTLVGAGACAIVSIRMGEKRREDAIHTLGNAFLLNLIIGLSFTVVALIFLKPLLRLFGASDDTMPYASDYMRVILAGNVITHIFFGLNHIMRASGHPTKAMVSILMTVTVNIVLTPIFIFGLGWGIKGAAFATVIAQFVGMIWVLAHFSNKRSYIGFKAYGFRLSGTIIRDIFAIGMSPFFIHISASLVTIVMNLQLGRHGGDLAIGAFGIVHGVLTLIVMVIFGFTQGMQPIVGYNYGALKMDRVFQALKLAIFWASLVSVLGFLACMVFPAQISRAFARDQAFIEITAHGMRINAALFAVVGFQIVVSNFFQSIGRARVAVVLSLSRQLICLLPFLLLFPLVWGLDGVWAAHPAADLAASILAALILHTYVKRGLLLPKRMGMTPDPQLQATDSTLVGDH
ncbi:MAG: MATE family efflux transporter [Bradymonadales bacterium]|nr:MATE family efflux transporter [Bradymonadales bacterium]